MEKLKHPPIWPAFVICAAIFYFVCFYDLRLPFWLYHCERNDISQCSDFFKSGLRWQVLQLAALYGTPGLLILLIFRKSLIFLAVWLGCFALWTGMIHSSSFGVDGQNGCEVCDFLGAAMMIVSLVSAAVVIGAAVLVLVERIWPLPPGEIPISPVPENKSNTN